MFQIIRPVTVTPAILTSSNVPEPDTSQTPPEELWVAGTYDKGDRAIDNHYIYEVVADPSTTDQPSVGAAKAVPTWVRRGASNRWRMFDGSVGSQSTNPETVEVEITPGIVINSVALLNMSGRTALIELYDGSSPVFSREYSLTDAGVTNWYDYFFSPIGTVGDLVVTDLPAYGNGVLHVTIDAGAEVAAIGELVIGSLLEVGCAKYDASVGTTSFSKKERDTFGNWVIVKRSNSKRASWNFTFPTSRLAMLNRIFADLDAVPVVWIGSPHPNYEGTIVYGFYRDYDLSYTDPRISSGSVTIEGIT